MNRIYALFICFAFCIAGCCFANEETSAPETTTQMCFDLSPLKAYLEEQITSHQKIMASLPAKKNREQKTIYWLHSGKLQSYREILNTIELLEHNAQ